MQVGKLQEGIVCSAWSPDQEFLAICTGARQLVLLSKVISSAPVSVTHTLTLDHYDRSGLFLLVAVRAAAHFV